MTVHYHMTRRFTMTDILYISQSMCISVDDIAVKIGIRFPSGYGNNGETLFGLFLGHPVNETTP